MCIVTVDFDQIYTFDDLCKALIVATYTPEKIDGEWKMPPPVLRDDEEVCSVCGSVA